MNHVRELFIEYAQSLGFSLCFQGFQKELDELPGCYAPPPGIILVAEVEGKLAGVVALRRRSETIAEMKRLYVRPNYRGMKLGEALVTALLHEAQAMGYQQMVLDTVPAMQVAQGLYTRLGFTDIPAYYDNSTINSRCMGINLVTSSCTTTQ
jgi:putative acetyltransferase